MWLLNNFTWPAVHQQVLTELSGYTDVDLDEPVDEPDAVFDTKLGSRFFFATHAMLHAGQIGLPRRLLGKNSLR